MITITIEVTAKQLEDGRWITAIEEHRNGLFHSLHTFGTPTPDKSKAVQGAMGVAGQRYADYIRQGAIVEIINSTGNEVFHE